MPLPRLPEAAPTGRPVARAGRQPACRAALVISSVAALAACLPLPSGPERLADGWAGALGLSAGVASGTSPLATAEPSVSGSARPLGDASGAPANAFTPAAPDVTPLATPARPASPDLASAGLVLPPKASPSRALPAASLGSPPAAGPPSGAGGTTAGRAWPAEALGPLPVLRAVDGDTLRVEGPQGPESVRLIGVDTPEVVDPREGVGCGGPEASAYTKASLTGQRIWMAGDPTQDERDRYGRRLVYVWQEDGVLFNEALIAAGHAREYTYSRPYRFQARFREAQGQACRGGLGLWAHCVTDSACSGLPSPLARPASTAPSTSAAVSPGPAPASPPLTPAPAASPGAPGSPQPSCAADQIWVNPYTRSDGTRVSGYCRKR